MATETDRMALADRLEQAIDAWRSAPLSDVSTMKRAMGGLLVQNIDLVLAALRSEAGAAMREAEEFGHPDESDDATMAVVDQIEAAAEYAYAPDGTATLTWAARQAIGRLVQGEPMRVELRPDTSALNPPSALPVLDEALITSASAVHAEMMSGNQLWIGIDGRNGEHARLIVDVEYERPGSKRFVLRLRGEDEGNPIAEANAARARQHKEGERS